MTMAQLVAEFGPSPNFLPFVGSDGATFFKLLSFIAQVMYERGRRTYTYRTCVDHVYHNSLKSDLGSDLVFTSFFESCHSQFEVEPLICRLLLHQTHK